MAMLPETTLWVTTDGIRCVVRPYDETRFQLRLLRATGTVRTELFAEYEKALATAAGWLRQIRETQARIAELKAKLRL